MPTRRPRLISLGAVLNELGFVYRKASSGKMAWVDAAAAARVLREIRHLLETTSLEARLRALEEAAAEPARPTSNRTGMHRIERRLRRLERRRAHEECDPVEANRIAVQCHDAGLPLPDTLTGEARAIAEAIISMLSFYDNMWSEEPLPLQALLEP